MAAWMVERMGAVEMNLDLGTNGQHLPFRQRPCGCGVVAPYLGANLRLRSDWRTHDGLAQFAVAAQNCEEAAAWLDFPQEPSTPEQRRSSRLRGRVRGAGEMVMLGVDEVQSLAVYYQNRGAILQETPEQQARWDNGYDWTALSPAHGARANTSWLSQIGTRDYVQRRIAETVRDAATAIQNGNYTNPGVHVAIMNTEDSRSSGLHWVLVMYEILGPA